LELDSVAPPALVVPQERQSRFLDASVELFVRIDAELVNAARKLTPYRRLKIDPLSGVRLVV
jgi:hypothetical protein